MSVIWICYTTLYRDAGPKFERAAHTLMREKRAARPGIDVRCERVESKGDFVRALERIHNEGKAISELHFIGHGGMYGPMFRTTAMPEQFSPHEWRTLSIPFAEDANAYFHACRSARWFAPFFARTFGVTAHGYHLYTTISTRPDRFRLENPLAGPDAPLYVVACPGKKSHGLLGSARKYMGLSQVETMRRFEPLEPEGDTTYDTVSDLYDRAFADITVREDEWRWLSAKMPKGRPRVLDIGCGNGALLAQFGDRISFGVGVDKSSKMVERARTRNVHNRHLSFATIDGPRLPFEDASFDVVVSMLSFRYLDWDPIMNEIRRVLSPSGRILIVDMVTAPLRVAELATFTRTKARHAIQQVRRPRFRKDLEALVTNPHWKTMLKYNPIRAEHEYKWYLESRFAGRRVEVLNIGWDARVVAFDSGPLPPGWTPPQTYP